MLWAQYWARRGVAGERGRPVLTAGPLTASSSLPPTSLYRLQALSLPRVPCNRSHQDYPATFSKPHHSAEAAAPHLTWPVISADTSDHALSHASSLDIGHCPAPPPSPPVLPLNHFLCFFSLVPPDTGPSARSSTDPLFHVHSVLGDLIQSHGLKFRLYVTHARTYYIPSQDPFPELQGHTGGYGYWPSGKRIPDALVQTQSHQFSSWTLHLLQSLQSIILGPFISPTAYI